VAERGAPAPPPAATVAARHPATGTVVVLVAAWVVMLGALILAGEAVVHSSALLSFDHRITSFVVQHRSAALNRVMRAVTWAGSWLATLAVAALVTVAAWRRRLPRAAVAAVLAAWFGELLAVTVTKAAVQRPRPSAGVQLVAAHGWSFPSGHTANAVVVCATGAVIVSAFLPRRRSRRLIWAVAVVATALIGFSRIELGVHWTTDVVASTVWTVGWLVIVARLLGRPRVGRRGPRITHAR
jgi:undecaprenyl-diphosphatase